MTPQRDEWFAILVGHQWPSDASLNVLTTSGAQRSELALEASRYADQLASIRNSALIPQQGITAERTQQAFADGWRNARELATKNHDKERAYALAHTHLVELRNRLSDIATAGALAIHEIESSDDLQQLKVSKIVAVVSESQSAANFEAAKHSEQVLNAIQMNLTASGLDTPARVFARSHGAEIGKAFGSTNIDAVRDSVLGKLHMLLPPIGDSESTGLSAERLVGAGETPAGLLAREHSTAQETQQSHDAVANGTTPKSPSIAIPARVQPFPQSAAQTLVTNAETPSEVPPVLPVPHAIAGGSPNPAQPNSPALRTPAASLPNSAPPSGTLSQSISPTDLAHSLSAGPQAGAPISAGAESVSPSGVHAAHQTPTHTSALAAATVAPATPMATGSEVAVAHAPVESATPPSVIAAPQPTVPTVAPSPPPIAVATPTSTPGVLPAYGADLKAPAATVPAAASPTPAAPISAPVSGGAANALGQPSVVRHQSAPPAATTVAALTERAVAATATGSIVGAAAAQATAQERLNRLLASVARQAPELGWAVGDRDDQTTVLTTDLASGWIPPNVKIPSGVTVLEPAKRSGTLAVMLGATTLTAVHAPGQHVLPDNADDPTFSTRPRKTEDVEDLHWELAQATKWRDGLPRLAHTLARAISSGTGYLESEVELLQDSLHSIADEAVAAYPKAKSDLIGNWQLLATIEALIGNETTCANYHLAWFRALSPMGSGNK